MSGTRFLLLYLGTADGRGPWLRLASGEVVARGVLAGPTDAIDGSDLPETVIGVVPGSDVAVHWFALPDLSEAQAAAAARLMASEVSAERLDNLHASLSARADEAGERILGIVGADRMAAWIAEGQARGYDPDAIVPETLLLSPPEQGLATIEAGGLILVRGRRQAFAAEQGLVTLLAGDAPLTPVSPEAVEAGLGELLSALPLDLRTGPFRKRRRWRIDWALVRRLAALAALILLANIIITLIMIARYDGAAERAEARTEAIARAALPRATRVTNPGQQLAARLGDLRGGGAGLPTLLGALFEGVRAVPSAEIRFVQFDPAGLLRATVTAASPADIDAVRARIEASGVSAGAGTASAVGARQSVEFRITGR